jgi:hypothetical protein
LDTITNKWIETAASAGTLSASRKNVEDFIDINWYKEKFDAKVKIVKLPQPE